MPNCFKANKSIGETARIDRDWTLYKSALSGDINTPNDQNDNSYHVVIGADRAVLDGFTITGGNANVSGYYFRGFGGGIHCINVSQTISNCVITNNNCSADGGGMFNYESDPTVTNCFFIDNKTSTGCGGGMWNCYGSPTITNCVFSGNTAMGTYGTGGGMGNWPGSPTVVTNCTFSRNSAYYNGGGMDGDSEATVTNCIFWGNTDNDGQNDDESAQISGTPTVTYSCIEGLTRPGPFDDPSNIGDDPCFVDANDPCGTDGVFGTLDDGLQLDGDTDTCIDAANGNAAPATDILGHGRADVNDVNNTGKGDPNYADIGAYEFFYDLRIVIMVWINESTPQYTDLGGWDLFESDLANYRNVVSSVAVVKSGCRVPTNEYEPHPITHVLPAGYPYNPYNPPEGIGVENCNRPPSDPTNLDELINDFEDIRGDIMPDYLLLVVDNSGSMFGGDVWPGWPDVTTNYDNFVNEVEVRCPGIVIPEMRTFGSSHEDWVNEITKAIQSLLNEL